MAKGNRSSSRQSCPFSPVTTNVTVLLARARRSRPVAPATRKLAHRTSDASWAARAPAVPYVVFCTAVRPPRPADRSRPGELTASNPDAGGPSLTLPSPGGGS
jgi:hypothetical protein